MNFNYGMNFNVKAAKVEPKKPEEGEKGKDEKPEEATSPKSAPETVVLTGNATEIQAAINRATVRGAMGTTATQQIEGDNRDFGAMLAEYCQMRQFYLDHLEQFSPEGKKDRLLEMQTKIENIVNFWYDNYAGPNSQNQYPEWFSGWPIHNLNELYEDYNTWANETIDVTNWIQDHGEIENLGPIGNMFRALDEDHHALNPHFVYDMMEPGIGRVNYFRGKVQEYQNVINQMNETVQIFIAEFGYAAFSPYAQEFDQRLAEFQAKLSSAERYLDLANKDLPSHDDELNKIVEQNQLLER